MAKKIVCSFAHDIELAAAAMEELMLAYDPNSPYANDSTEYSADPDYDCEGDSVRHTFRMFGDNAVYPSQGEAIAAATNAIAALYCIDPIDVYIAGVHHFDGGAEFTLWYSHNTDSMEYVETFTMEAPWTNPAHQWRLLHLARDTNKKVICS